MTRLEEARWVFFGLRGLLIFDERLALDDFPDECLEFLNELGELRGLGAKICGDVRAFLGTGGVVLSHRVHLRDGGVDLVDALALLIGGDGNLGDQFVGLAGLADDVSQTQ